MGRGEVARAEAATSRGTKRRLGGEREPSLRARVGADRGSNPRRRKGTPGLTPVWQRMGDQD